MSGRVPMAGASGPGAATRATARRVASAMALAVSLVAVAATAAQAQRLPAVPALAIVARAKPVADSGAARVRALADSGRYDEAELLARRGAALPGGAAYLTPLGEVLRLRGRREAAESAFTRAVAAGAADSLTASLDLAILHHERGDRERAGREFDHFIDVYNTRAVRLTSDEMTAVAIACRYLGATQPALFKDALKAFDRAIALDGGNRVARAALGELFLEKYNGAEAQKTFEELMSAEPEYARGLLGEAKRRLFDGQPGGDSLLARALTANPNYVDALVVRAREALDRERTADAQRDIDRALAVDPSSSEAIAVGAALRYLAGDLKGFEALKARALALDPRDAGFFVTLADATGRVRRYDIARDFAAQGVALDAQDWKAYSLLGMNLLRLGRIPEGRTALETSFKGDPYDVWVKNTLDLLDTFGNYAETVTPHARLVVEKAESPLLTLYLGDLVERAYTTFGARYQYAPSEPIRIEVYRSHADFSVRTVGLAGLGALGVSFGTTLAFDSPAAKDAGAFNWASTVWHELAHTFTLGSTDHRVPRWFSEGLSVWEEHQASPFWGFKATESFAAAAKAGKLLPMGRLNDGFVRPQYAEQVQHSYYLASLVCEFIVKEKGEGAIVAMLREYKAGRSTEEVFAKVLGTDLKAFDTRFMAYVNATLAEHPPVDADAVRDSARALEAAGQDAAAIGAWVRIAWQDESDTTPHLAMSRIHAKQGRLDAAADELERAIWIDPFELAWHERLAAWSTSLGTKERAVRERRAVVALDPVDRAEAYYQLALAERAAGDAAAAKRSVLRSLEEAPMFVKAQELLLAIVDGRMP